MKNDGFTPSDEELAKARAQLAAELAQEEEPEEEKEEEETWVEVTFHLRSGRDLTAEMPEDDYLKFEFNDGWEHHTFNWVDDDDRDHWLEVWKSTIEAISAKELG